MTIAAKIAKFCSVGIGEAIAVATKAESEAVHAYQLLMQDRRVPSGGLGDGSPAWGA